MVGLTGGLGQGNLDAGSTADFGFHSQYRSDQLSPLTHVLLPVMGSVILHGLAGVESMTIVLHRQDDHAVHAQQGDFQLSGIGMLEDVGDGFLCDVQKLALLLVGKPGITLVEIQSGSDADVFG